MLEAGGIGGSGEVILLDMETVRALDMAQARPAHLGLMPKRAIDTAGTEIRPAEKLFGGAEATGEHREELRRPETGVRKIEPCPDPAIRGGLKPLGELIEVDRVRELRQFCDQFVPEANAAPPAAERATDRSEAGS